MFYGQKLDNQGKKKPNYANLNKYKTFLYIGILTHTA